jgi:predicted ATPase
MSTREGPPEFYVSEMAIENFKIHRKSGRIVFKPITLIIGPNSSGKTALFQPLLMLKQSFETPTAIGPIVLNGDIVNLGSFDDIVTNHDLKKAIRVALVVERAPTRKERHSAQITLDLTLAYDAKRRRMYLPEVIVTDKDAGVRVRVIEGKMIVMKGRKVLLRSVHTDPNVLSSLRGLTLYGVFTMLFREALPGQGRTAGVSSMFVPRKTPTPADVDDILKASSAVSMLSSALSSLDYVGPLRDYPQRYYGISGERFHSVGRRGEKAIEIVYERRHDYKDGITSELAKWLGKLGVAKTIRFKETGKGLYSLVLSDPVTGARVNIVDVGFGVSQIVPMIVQTCLMDENTVAILEQPEIHLHPLGQMVFADLIVEAARRGKRFIVESHSEHVLLRIQRRIAEGILPSDSVAVYFLGHKRRVALRRIEISPSGQLKDLPPGFMDERLEEAYRIASVQK